MLKTKGIYAIIGLLGVFAVLHVMFVPEHHDLRTTIQTLLGGTAFLLMTCTMILSTRIGAAEDWFGGLDRMYQVHKYSAVTAVLLVVVHFLLVPGDLSEFADGAENVMQPSAPLGVISLVLLMLGALLALNRKIRYSLWHPTHKVMVLMYILVVVHFLKAPPVFFVQLNPSGILLIAAAMIGVLSGVYSVFFMKRRTGLPFSIEEVNLLERTTEVVLKPVGRMLDFKAGQFAFIEIEGKGWNEPHPFTISSAPGENRLRFSIKVLGDWTRKVRDDLKPGGNAIVRGPYGRFDTSAAGPKQVWLAGGIGVTPFLSMMRAMEPDDDRQIHLFFATRSRTDALFLEELIARAAELDNVTLTLLFSDEGQYARIDTLQKNLSEPAASFTYFMCGPKPMVHGLTKALRSKGVKRPDIYSEAFEFR